VKGLEMLLNPYNEMCGVYCILNITTGERYIGKSINIYKRVSRHFDELKANKHCNHRLQNAYNVYGKNKFILQIIKTCDKQILHIEEKYYIRKYNPEYNIVK
jgi:group I intron endonuclease